MYQMVLETDQQIKVPSFWAPKKHQDLYRFFCTPRQSQGDEAVKWLQKLQSARYAPDVLCYSDVNVGWMANTGPSIDLCKSR